MKNAVLRRVDDGRHRLQDVLRQRAAGPVRFAGAQCPREIQLAPDYEYTAVYGETRTVFLRSIYVTDGYQVHGPRGRPARSGGPPV